MGLWIECVSARARIGSKNQLESRREPGNSGRPADCDLTALESLPQEEKGLYNTLAGLIMLLTGNLPRDGEAVHAMGWRFEVIDLDGRRIDKVLASISHEKAEDEDG